jgi:hypothetical protein
LTDPPCSSESEAGVDIIDVLPMEVGDSRGAMQRDCREPPLKQEKTK